MRRGGKLGPITALAPTATDRRPSTGRTDPRLAAHARPWFKVSNVGVGTVRNDSTRIDIYEEIGGWGVTAAEFVESLRAVQSPTIELHVNSPGGSVFDGVAIYNAISQHPADVRGFVDGLAASAASFIIQACNEITMNPGSMMMVHAPIGMTWGNEFDHEEMTGLLRQIVGSIADLYAARAGGDRAQWLGVMNENRGAGKWYEAADAVAAGLADKVAGTPEGNATGEPAEGDGAGDTATPADVFDRSSIAAGHRLVAAYRDQVLAALQAPTARPETLADVVQREFAATIAAWEREAFALAPEWPNQKTTDGDVPLVQW